MKIFYDTEFLEDGKTIELISIGMVAEDGRELYLVREEIATDQALYDRICRHEWLMANVIPHLPLAQRPDGMAPIDAFVRALGKAGRFDLDMDDRAVMPARQIRKEVRHFVQSTRDAELWAWYGAYDHVALAQLFGRMIDLPDGVPMWTNDLKQECQRIGNPALPILESTPHDALEDARWVRDVYAWLTTREDVAA